MANPFDELIEKECAGEASVSDDQGFAGKDLYVYEGFVCSECFCKFKNQKTLLIHFEQSHEEKPTFEQLGSAIKGIFGKTKKIFEFEPEFRRVQKHLEQPTSRTPVSHAEDGPTTSHREKFIQRRKTRNDSSVLETNKLIKCLDELLQNAPSNPEQRKQHEKSVVDWVDDELVTLCPQCAKMFNLSRRKHHCRLCGGILCHDCSLFLDHTYYGQLVGPLDASQLSRPSSALSSLTKHTGISVNLPSVVSVPTSSGGEPMIRVCKDCKLLLDRRSQQMRNQSIRPGICDLYDRLRHLIRESDKLIAQYYQLYQSICDDNGNYEISNQHADEVKSKIIQLAEYIDIVSKKITSPASELDPENSTMHRQLQSRIRIAAANYLREEIMSLPPIPSEDEIMQLREERSKAAALQLQAAEAATSARRGADALDSDGGWTPEVRPVVEDLDDKDPMLIQIEQIKHFIQLAKKDNKYDEAGILESNLKELELEYMVQKLNSVPTE